MVASLSTIPIGVLAAAYRPSTSASFWCNTCQFHPPPPPSRSWYGTSTVRSSRACEDPFKKCARDAHEEQCRRKNESATDDREHARGIFCVVSCPCPMTATIMCDGDICCWYMTYGIMAFIFTFECLVVSLTCHTLLPITISHRRISRSPRVTPT